MAMGSDPLNDFFEKKKPKSLYRDRSGQIWSFYCPLCQVSRKLPIRPRPGSARQIAQVGIASAFTTLVFWPLFHFKGLFSFFLLWTAFEIGYRLYVRGRLGCPHCGFDPYLYMDDEVRAKTEIETHWRKKYADKGIPYPGDPLPAARPENNAPPGP